MIKLKRIDPDSNRDENDTKEDEPEITVDSKGSVSLKPKESEEEKEEKKIEAAKPIETMVPTAPAAPVAPVSAPKAAPVAQNATHEVVPVVENVAKEVTTTDPTTGSVKKEIVKVPEVKNKVVPKAATPFS
jgi:hypothetical protein